MNSKKTPLRASGQSSIAFFSRSSNSQFSARDFKEDSTDKGSKKVSGSRISLSDFLDRKLQKSSALSKTVQEKSKPFSSLVGAKDVVESAGRQSRDKKEGEGVAQNKKEGEGEGSGILDKVVFQQFKPGVTEKVDCTDPSSICEEGTPNTDDEPQNSRKRKNPFENGNEHRARKPYIVLGDDPRVKQNDSKPKQRGRRDQPTSNKKQRPLYNHYASGCGWWDGDMECVDDEEVGYGEVWEGVGSTTLGEIVDWH